MILFLNVAITDDFWTSYDRGLFGPVRDRLDVFKYSLASYAVLPWSAVYIYCELRGQYSPRRAELEQIVYTLFPQAHLFDFQIKVQKEWRKCLSPLFNHLDPTIYFCCNDDHIYIDYDPQLLLRLEKALNVTAEKYPYASLYMSHWVEQTSLVNMLVSPFRHNPDAQSFIRETNESSILEDHPEYTLLQSRNVDSVQLLRRELLQYWWNSSEYGDDYLPRSDMYGKNGIDTHPEQVILIPKRELVRHYDAYSHGPDGWVPLNVCPPLEIPPGFFERDIKILCNTDERKSGWVTINPMSDFHSAVSCDGVDIRCEIEDIPFFWKERITRTIINHEYSPRELRDRRNQAYMLRTSFRTDSSEEALFQRYAITFRDGEVIKNGTLCNNKKTRVAECNYHFVRNVETYPGKPKLSIVLLEDTSIPEYTPYAISRLHASNSQVEGCETLLVATHKNSIRAIKKDDFSQVNTVIFSRQIANYADDTYDIPYAANIALRHATGNYVMFITNEMALGANYLNKLLKELPETSQNVALISPYPVYQPKMDALFPKLIYRPIFVASRERALAVNGFTESSLYKGDNWDFFDLWQKVLSQSPEVKVIY
jgi:hypothetical protein